MGMRLRVVTKRPSQAASATGWRSTSCPGGERAPAPAAARPQVSRLSPKTHGVAARRRAVSPAATAWSDATRASRCPSRPAPHGVDTSEWASPQAVERQRPPARRRGARPRRCRARRRATGMGERIRMTAPSVPTLERDRDEEGEGGVHPPGAGPAGSGPSRGRAGWRGARPRREPRQHEARRSRRPPDQPAKPAPAEQRGRHGGEEERRRSARAGGASAARCGRRPSTWAASGGRRRRRRRAPRGASRAGRPCRR